MGDIIDIRSKFKKPPPKPTVQELAQFCIDEILGHWEKFASNNKLNDYFVSSTSMYCKGGVNYLEDLNALSVIEQRIYLEQQVIAPGFNEKQNALGWVAAFRLNGVIVATPFMVSEQYARCFLILLFLKLKRELQSAGIPVS